MCAQKAGVINIAIAESKGERKDIQPRRLSCQGMWQMVIVALFFVVVVVMLVMLLLVFVVDGVVWLTIMGPKRSRVIKRRDIHVLKDKDSNGSGGGGD